MKHIQVKLSKNQSKVFTDVVKEHSWLKMTTNKDVLYFPENKIAHVYDLVINKSNFKSFVKKLDKSVGVEYASQIKRCIKKGFEPTEIMELVKPEELEDYKNLSVEISDI